VALFILRFDLRDPGLSGVPRAERYRAALDMAEYAEERGFVAVVLSEHHGSEDGYLPSALTFAAAVAARTSRIRIQVAAIAAPLHDPVRLAEQAAVVDLIAQGRLALVLANGYVPAEFAMAGVPMPERVARTVETVETLRSAWTGERFDYRGRSVLVRPAPHAAGGPAIELGGSSDGAARRAARLGVGFVPTEKGPWEVYRKERIALGHDDPGELFRSDSRFFHLSDEPDADWDRIAPYAMHESNAYARWLAEAGGGIYKAYDDADALRASGDYRVLPPRALAEELHAEGPFALATFHPLMGGLAPELGWESLRRVEAVQRELTILDR
jgi:alkanesulfonate monooxygenase SsuD/methylene tetrahydromethanopterin reductase-like flavin-dependent oxidoreductase (luciferase family)